MHCRRWPMLLVMMLCCGCGQPENTAVRPAEPAAVLQAGMVAGLRLPLEKLLDRYQQQTGMRVLPTFADRTQLAQQLAAGAPYDLLIAETGSIGALAGAGLLDAASMRPLVEGVLVVMTAADGVPPPADLRELAQPRYARVALPDPEQTIYGSAARTACTRLGLWQQLQPRIVLTRNAAQAAVYAEQGEVAAAFVPLAGALDRRAPYYAVPEELYPPIMHAMATAAATERQAEATAFLAYLLTPECRTVWEKFGFRIPPAAGGTAPVVPRGDRRSE